MQLNTPRFEIMSAPRLFINDKLSANSDRVLRGEAARYVGRVLRCRPGDALALFDGSGSEFAAVITTINKQEVNVRIADAAARNVESPLDVRLLQGISRGERMDIVVQKATELGVRRITPLLTEFSVVRLDSSRAEKRQQHWQRIATSACEQCGRNIPPTVDTAATLQDYLQAAPANDCNRLLLQHGASNAFTDRAGPPGAIELLIGPEGGLSSAEQDTVIARGFVPVSLGPRVLRTETAAIAALALVQSLWGDLGTRA